MQQNLWFYAVVGLSLVATSLVIIVCGADPIFPMDDAYIYTHNATVLLSGEDNNYQGTPALIGTTSAPHLLLITILSLAMKPLTAMATACWLATLIYALGLSRLALNNKMGIPKAALFVALGLTAARVPHHLFNGLETGLAMSALVWTMVAFDSRSRATPILCGLLPFLRPELVCVALLLLLFRGLGHWQQHRRIGPTCREITIDLGMAGLSATPWAAWHMQSMGLPYPTTIAAKRFFFAEGGQPLSVKFDWTWQALKIFCTNSGLLCIAVLFLVRTRVGLVGLAFFAVFVGVYMHLFPGALKHYEERYLHILVPFMLYGLASVLAHRRKALRIGASFLLIAALAQSLIRLPSTISLHHENCSFTATEIDALASWCEAMLPSESTVLIHDAGYMAAATSLKLVDLVGLKTPSSIAVHRRLTWPSGKERPRAIHTIAQATKSDFLVVLDGWDQIYAITSSLKRNGWTVARVRHSPGGYSVFQLAAPGSRIESIDGLPQIQTPLNASEFETKTTGNIIPDGWAMWEVGYLQRRVHILFEQDSSIRIRARGTPANNIPPEMKLLIDDDLVCTWKVSSTNWSSYRTTCAIPPGWHNLKIAFENDAFIGSEDRNLFVGDVEIKNGVIR